MVSQNEVRKMLRIVDVELISGGRLVVDAYVPFRFRLEDVSLVSGDPLLWHTGNLKTSLLEVRIERRKHFISGVTLTSFPGPVESGAPNLYKNTEVVQGLPVIAISLFPDNVSVRPR